MTTRAELRTLIRAIGRFQTHDVSDSTMDTYLDEGYREVVSSREWPWCYITTPQTITMVSGTAEYAINAAVKRIISVVNVDQKYPLRKVSQSDWANVQNQVTGSTHPVAWTMGNRTLHVWPTPGTTDDLDVYHYGHPAWAAADATEPAFDEAFHEMLANWALSRLWEQEEDMEKADDYRARFEVKLIRMGKFYDSELSQRPAIFGGGALYAQPSNMPFLTDAASGGAT